MDVVNFFTEMEGKMISGSMQYGVFRVIFLETVGDINNSLISRPVIHATSQGRI
jgi:hypothetical protein